MNIQTIATHSGPFHADDVFCIAMLRKLYPEAKVIRSRDDEVLDKCDLVLDVGVLYDHEKRRYDHHQDGRAGSRENGIMYSALGLIWRYYGLDWCDGDEFAHKYIDDHFVQATDAVDNGQDLYSLTDFKVSPLTMQDVIFSHYPVYGDVQDFDKVFFAAVDFAEQHLGRLLHKAKSVAITMQKAVDSYAATPDKRYLQVDEYIPLNDQLTQAMPELLYYVYPGAMGNWMIKTVKATKGSFVPRKALPEPWAALRGEDFVRATGVDDAEFCHNALFICGAKTKEGIMKLLALALAS
jgi:uncharacterized UPF0160 family protein